MLEDSQAKLVVTDNKNLSLARELARNRLLVLNLEKLDSGLSSENLSLPIRPEIACRIIYTSGSTGEPKGVVLNHRRILHNVKSVTNGCLVCTSDRVALFNSPRTSQGMVTSYVALLNGAALCLFDVSKKGLVNIASWLADEKITIYISVPAVFRSFAGALAEGQEFPHLRVIKLGADQVTQTDVELFKTRFPNCLLKIFLGSTETGSLCHYAIDKETDLTSNIVPVGYPVEGIEILLLDDNGKEVGNDRIGEIVVRSRYLALGYWRRPDLTGGKFLADPEGGDRRIYLTGDLGRRRSDGRLEYLGRMDSRVEIRGYTVETGEIEAILGRHPAVRETVVLTAEENGEMRLVAYIVTVHETSVTVPDLRQFLNQFLPRYMVPSTFIFLESLPLTPNGKIDRRALPKPDSSRSPLETPFLAPRTSTEARLANIWAEVLKINVVGIHDDFFELGGHSLSAARIISKINEGFGLEVAMRSLLDDPTVASLAEVVEVLRSTTQNADPLSSDCTSDEETGEL